MSKLATPISHLFEDDLAREEIIARSCCLECREESLGSEAPKQYLFHFDKDINYVWGEDEKSFVRSAILAKRELKLATFHMSASCSQPVLKQGMFHRGGREFSRQEMLENIRKNIDWLRASIRDRNIAIAMENNNYYPTPAYQYIADADFISQVVLENQVMFLFDLAHAKITAHNRGEPYQGYVAGLPLEKMIQVHVSQHEINEQGVAFDAHALPDESVFQEVNAIIRKYSPEYVTIEYYKDKDNLIRLLEQYQQLSSE